MHKVLMLIYLNIGLSNGSHLQIVSERNNFFIEMKNVMKVMFELLPTKDFFLLTAFLTKLL